MTTETDLGPEDAADYPWDEQRRRRVAKVVVELFGYWDLPMATQARLMGFSTADLGEMALLRDGGALPDRPDTRERLGCLLGIHRALKILYPANPEIVQGWVHRPMPVFGGKAPIEVMAAGDIAGITTVYRYLIDRLKT